MYSSASLLGSVCNLKTQDMVVTLCIGTLLQILLYSMTLVLHSVNCDVGNPKD